MDSIKKKKISIVSSVVVFILAIIMTVSLFLPTFKVGTYDLQASEDYYNAAMTQYATPFGEADISPFIIVDIIKNYNDIHTVLEIQTLESNMTYYTSKAVDLYASMGAHLSEEENAAIKAEVDALVAKAGDVNAELEKIAEEFGEERQLALAERLSDEKFVTALAFSHQLVRDYCKVFVEVDNSVEKQGLAVTVASFAELALLLIYAIALPIWFIVFAIMIIVKLVIFVVRVVSAKEDPKAVIKEPRFPFLSLAMTFFSVFVLLRCVSSLEFSIGLGLWMALAVAVIASLERCVVRAVTEGNRVLEVLMNGAVCVAIIVMCVFLTMQFLDVDLVNDLKLSTSEFGSVYSSALTGASVSESEIAEAVGKANLANVIKIFTLSGICLCVLLFAVGYAVKQLSNEGKMKINSKRSVSLAGIVVCAVVLAVTLVPSFMGTESADTCFKKYQNGDYKMLWGAYRYSGMTVAANYSSYESFRTTCVSTIAAIEEKLPTADETEKEKLETSLRETKNYKEITELKMERTIVNKKQLASMSMAAGVALLVVQFIYTFIMHDDKKKKLTEELDEILESNGDVVDDTVDTTEDTASLDEAESQITDEQGTDQAE